MIEHYRKRNHGRPTAIEAKQDDEERAQAAATGAAGRFQSPLPVELPNHVPPQRCPHCHRGMQPSVLRRRTERHGRIADCRCRLCGRDFQYQFPVLILPRQQAPANPA